MKPIPQGLRLRGDLKFPPGKSGGLIEARSGDDSTSPDRAEFPPGKSGGLIEAKTSPQFSLSLWNPRFRRVNPAASLKPCM